MIYLVLVYPLTMSYFVSDVKITLDKRFYETDADIVIGIKGSGWIFNPVLLSASINDIPFYEVKSNESYRTSVNRKVNLKEFNLSTSKNNYINIHYSHPIFRSPKQRSYELSLLS